MSDIKDLHQENPDDPRLKGMIDKMRETIDIVISNIKEKLDVVKTDEILLGATEQVKKGEEEWPMVFDDPKYPRTSMDIWLDNLLCG